MEDVARRRPRRRACRVGEGGRPATAPLPARSTPRTRTGQWRTARSARCSWTSRPDRRGSARSGGSRIARSRNSQSRVKTTDAATVGRPVHPAVEPAGQHERRHRHREDPAEHPPRVPGMGARQPERQAARQRDGRRCVPGREARGRWCAVEVRDAGPEAVDHQGGQQEQRRLAGDRQRQEDRQPRTVAPPRRGPRSRRPSARSRSRSPPSTVPNPVTSFHHGVRWASTACSNAISSRCSAECARTRVTGRQRPSRVCSTSTNAPTTSAISTGRLRGLAPSTTPRCPDTAGRRNRHGRTVPHHRRHRSGGPRNQGVPLPRLRCHAEQNVSDRLRSVLTTRGQRCRMPQRGPDRRLLGHLQRRAFR